MAGRAAAPAPTSLSARRRHKGFDAAWACISNDFRGDPDEIKAGRRALAIAVLSVADEGSRDVEVLKNAALQAMALEYRGKLRRSL